jgi:hypothetical protein
MRSIGYCVTVIIAWRDGLRSNYDLGDIKGKFRTNYWCI